jgi:hypothetical protein
VGNRHVTSLWRHRWCLRGPLLGPRRDGLTVTG